jgi:hypothetical protein
MRLIFGGEFGFQTGEGIHGDDVFRRTTREERNRDPFPKLGGKGTFEKGLNARESFFFVVAFLHFINICDDFPAMEIK